MDVIQQIISFVLHIDQYLEVFVQQYGALTYAILFAVIFCETGLVVTPFLPGDSLLFAAGALSASLNTGGVLNPFALFVVLALAAILGDTVNYMIGHFIGVKLLERNIPFLKKEYIDRTNEFYEKYGGKTIILARFVPIVRTFAPFVAGVGKMNYSRFITFNVVGGLVWVAIFVFLGYMFGNVPFVKQNFEIVTLGIVFVSVLPMLFEYLKSRRAKATPKADPAMRGKIDGAA
jgi:membrane-associated protein